MEPEALRAATERWVDADIVDGETAAEIHEYEREHGGGRAGGLRRAGGGRSRIVTAISVMGAVLVAAGVILILAANWGSLSMPVQTAVLVAGPLVASAVGLALVRSDVERVGHACWFAGALLLGPSLLLLGELHVPNLDRGVLLLAWALATVPSGYVLDSRSTSVVGLLAGFAGIALTVSDDAGQVVAAFVLAFAGTVLVGAAIPVRMRRDRLAGVYRMIGILPVTGVLLMIGLNAGQDGTLELGLGPVLVGWAVAATTVGVLSVVGVAVKRLTPADALSVVAPGLATLVGLGVLSSTAAIPVPGTILLVHATLLGLLVSMVAVGVAARSPSLVNLVSVIFFLQVLAFIVRVAADALSGALALVVAGVVLLAVSLALESGRRRALRRMQPT